MVICIGATVHLEQIFVNVQSWDELVSPSKGFSYVHKLAASVIDVENEQVGPSLDHFFKYFLHGKEDCGFFHVS